MTYPRSFNIENSQCGIVLIDILLAFSLSSLFILMISQSSAQARDIFDRAHERSDLLDMFESGGGQSISKLYGNDRIQTEISVYSTQSFQASTTKAIANPVFNQTIVFTSVKRRPGENDFAGTSLCSVDFSDKHIVGSYFAAQKDMGDVPADNVQITPITLPIDPLLPLTDIVVRNAMAYISADSSKASNADLMVVDIGDVAHPRMISTLNTGPGISSIVLARNKIYAAAASSVAQLHIISFSDQSHTILENKYLLPLPYATATPPFGSSIFYHNGFIYLGTEKWDGDEFSIIDVSKSSPMKMGSFKIGSKVNDIFVRDDIAYVASSDEKQLIILDMHDQAHPILADSFNPSGWQRQGGKTISLFEGGLDFGRTSGGFDITGDHELFAWASSTPFRTNPHSMNIPGGVYGILRDRSRTYAISGSTNHELQLFDNDLTTTTATYSLPVAPQIMTCDADRLYVLARTAPVIYEISFK